MKTNSLSAWILAVRPYSLGNSVILVLIGSALAWTDRGFHWLPAVLCLAFALLMQCTANLVNDLWDFLKGADQPDRLGPDRAFAKGYITLGAMKAGIAGFTLAACAAAVALCLTLLFAGRTWAALLPLPYLAAHISTWRKMVRIDHGDALNVCLGETARNILLFGALFTLGILLGR